jgi:hypothetical protein
MHLLREAVSIQTFLASQSDPELRQLIQSRLAELLANGEYQLEELCYFVVIEPGDGLAALESQLGFSIEPDGIDGTVPIRSPEFVLLHAGWYEIVFVLGDDGFGVEVFVPDCSGVDIGLLEICASYAEQHITP